MGQLRAALYIRVSTIEQAKEGFSLAAQENALRKYADAMGYLIKNVYKDDGFSGKNLERPAMSKMLTDLRSGSIDIILIYKLDRLSRNVKNVLEIVELLEKYNVKIFSLNENIDLSSPFGRAALKMSATFSELERETITERMIMGKEQRAKEGRAMRNSCLPIGYTYDEREKRFKIIPEEAEQVKKIFELYLKGWSFSQISAYMRQNYTNRYSSWNDRTSVGKVISNPFSSGYFWFKNNIYKATNIDPIIDYKTWLQAEKLRLDTKEKFMRPTSPYLLTGLMYCGKCGRRYVSKKYDSRRVGKKGKVNETHRLCYGCMAQVKHDSRYHTNCKNAIIRQNILDEYVLNAVKNLRFNEFKGDNSENTYNIIELQITEIKEKINRLLDLYENEMITKEDLELRITKHNKEIENKKRLLNEQREELSNKPVVDVEAIKNEIKNLDNLDLAQKRFLLRELINRIEINDNEITIDWKVQPID